MSSKTVYCLVCQREVPLAQTPIPLHAGESTLPDAQLVCLAFDRRCAGERCPVSGMPSAVMGVQLARSGIAPQEPWQTLELLCDGCGRVTEMEIVDDVYASCTECRTTNRRG